MVSCIGLFSFHTDLVRLTHSVSTVQVSDSIYLTMVLIGDIPKFDSHDDDWFVFTERLEQFFELNEFSDEKKKAILITSISDDDYKTLRDLCHPNLPKTKTFDELCELLTLVFRDRVTIVEENPMSDENIADCFARIKKMYGKFGGHKGHKHGHMGHKDGHKGHKGGHGHKGPKHGHMGHKGHKGIHKHHKGGHLGMRSRFGHNHRIHPCGRNQVIW